MPLESVTYISDLVVTNPVNATDQVAQGDDHIRAIKTGIKNTFPNISGAVTPTHTQLNIIKTDADGAGMLADIAALADPNADRILAWDDSAGAVVGMDTGVGIGIVGTTIRLSTTLGVLEDMTAFTDANADRIFGWDDSADAAIQYSLGTGLTTSGTSLQIDTSVVPRLGESNVFTASQTIGSGSGGAQLNFNSGTADGICAFNATGIFGTTTAHTTELYTNNTSRLAIDSSGNFDFKGGTVTSNNASASEVGYKGTPFNQQSDNYTCVLADAGKVIYQVGAGKTVTIPANASVAYPVGTVLTFVDGNGGGVTIAITSDTLALAGTGYATTGSRTLAAGGIAVAVKRNSTEWLISGNVS